VLAAARADLEHALEFDPGLEEARANLRQLSDGPRL
jgi:hypothetical protein